MITRIFIGFLLIASLLGLLYADEHFTGAAAKWLPLQHVPKGGILFAASALIILPLLALELSRLLRAISLQPPGGEVVRTIVGSAAAVSATDRHHRVESCCAQGRREGCHQPGQRGEQQRHAKQQRVECKRE